MEINILQDRNAKIQEAATQLTSGAITPMDFLNRILHNDQSLRQTLNDFTHVETDAHAEIDEFDFEIENYIAAQELQAHQIHNNPVVVLDQVSSNSQPDATVDDSSEDDTPPLRDGMCIVCLTNMANVLLFDCKHIATCEACRMKIKQTHIDNCQRWFAGNERKTARESVRIECPKCNEVYNKAEIIFLNSFN